ncbi:LacI family DNA-binding transcriptional regulator [Streptomyces sp. NPDC058576]|uniref:LacI family DNA-binding transcriptional regulator n=1 Tax=Streptomyces sp. NPDC058576 TaxID=3346547 RepID=UPI003664DC0F
MTSTSAGPLNRRATIKDVAALAGVSIATVSRVLSGKVPTTAPAHAKVTRAAKELRYVANAHARALLSQGPRTVAILVPDVTVPFFAHVAHGVEQQAAEEGRICLIGSTNGDLEKELVIGAMMREQGVEAVILVGGVVKSPTYRERMTDFARALDASGSHLVLCGRPPLGKDAPVSVVEYDNTAGSHAITSHLLAAGHRRILHLTGEPNHHTPVNRLEGYRRALHDHGYPYDEDLVLWRGFTRSAGAALMKQALHDQLDFTAVFAGNDLMAAGALDVLREAGIRVPEDVSLVGFDDIPLATDLYPKLTTVHLPHEELGRMAVRMVVDRDEHTPVNSHVVLGTHIVRRDSVRRRGGRPAAEV